jgi:hypothetical protein
MRRPLIGVLTACLLVGAAVGPAEAKKKPRKPAPVSFEESGSVALGHPGDLVGEANATRTAFLNSCAVPPSQGTDGYVIALPPEVTATNTNVTIAGGDLTGLHDLDMFFYDESCSPVGALSSELSDEFGLMPAGTSYVLVTAFAGVEITFDFKAVGV